MPRRHAALALCLCLGPLVPQQGAWAAVPGNPGAPRWTTGRMVFDRDRGVCVLVNGSEVWEATGTTWRLAASGPGIGGINGGFAYDRARRLAIWFGGGALLPSADTYTWDGRTWARLVTATVPAARSATALAYDAGRARVVMFGGIGTSGATLANTWEFDGTDWQRRAPATSPPPMSGHRMAYDALRRETVLFGSVSGAGQTWLYDGSTWRRNPGGDPPAMAQAAMTYDEARSRTVLTSGNVVQGTPLSTWEWDGANWNQVQPVGPVAYHTVDGAYDSVRGYPMLVAATEEGIDTWRWNGTGWLRATAFGRLPAYSGIAAAYHPASRAIVAFGGGYSVFGVVPTGGTFEYRRGSWQPRRLVTSPSARTSSAMATEPAGSLLLFGGRGVAPLADSWRWDGTMWSQLTPPASPGPRDQHAMATDMGRGRVVLFGGVDASGAPLAETWEWDGTTWQQRTPAVSPPPRFDPAITYDATRGRVLLFGGASSTSSFLDDLWEWDGASWTQRSTAVRPAARASGAFTFDPNASLAVLAGGYTYHFLGANVPVADAWTWDGTSWTPITNGAPTWSTTAIGVYHQELRSTVYSSALGNHELAFGSVAAVTPFGTGCRGTGAPPELAALSTPRTGNSQFALWLSNGLAGGLALIGLDLRTAALPLGSCTAYLPTPTFVVAATDAVGNATIPLAIPAVPSLHGVDVYAQALTFDPNGALANLASLSAALRITLTN